MGIENFGYAIARCISHFVPSSTIMSFESSFICSEFTKLHINRSFQSEPNLPSVHIQVPVLTLEEKVKSLLYFFRNDSTPNFAASYAYMNQIGLTQDQIHQFNRRSRHAPILVQTQRGTKRKAEDLDNENDAKKRRILYSCKASIVTDPYDFLDIPRVEILEPVSIPKIVEPVKEPVKEPESPPKKLRRGVIRIKRSNMNKFSSTLQKYM